MSILDYLEVGKRKLSGEAGNGDTLSHCPPISEIEEKLRDLSSKGIELTVTFKPELQDRWNAETLTGIVRDILKRNECKCILIGEYSPVGLYHMHGSIYAGNKTIAKLRRKFSREIGRCEWRQIKFIDSWTYYCLKNDETYTIQNEDYKTARKKVIDPAELIYLI